MVGNTVSVASQHPSSPRVFVGKVRGERGRNRIKVKGPPCYALEEENDPNQQEQSERGRQGARQGGRGLDKRKRGGTGAASKKRGGGESTL